MDVIFSTGYWTGLFCNLLSLSWDFFTSWEFLVAMIFFTIIKHFRNNHQMIEEVVTGDPPEKHYRFEECPQWFPYGWIPIMLERDIKKCRIKPITVFGHDLIIFRGISNRVHVLNAYCAHLGANIGFGGTVMGDEIRCPFHGWRYLWDGRCSWVSGLEKDEPIPKARIKEWKVTEMNGYVFVWYHPNEEQPLYKVERVDEIESEEYPYCFRYEGVIEQHIQDIVEMTGPDDRRFNITPRSPNWLFWLVKKTKSFHENVTNTWKSKWHFHDDHKASAKMECKYFAWNVPLLEAKYKVDALGPAYTAIRIDVLLFNYFSFSLFEMRGITPLAAVRHQLVYSEVANRIHYLNQARRDKLILDHKKFLARPYITKSSIALKHFRRWFLQFYDQESSYVKNYKDPYLMDNEGKVIGED